MPTAEQPNIVVFFGDDFGWGELGCYGGGAAQIPLEPGADLCATVMPANQPVTARRAAQAWLVKKQADR